MSDAELDAALSVLRTDKSQAIASVSAQGSRWGAMTEQLLRSASRPLSFSEAAAVREEAARHAWFIALGENVVGPLALEALRAHWDTGELGPDSLCWREGFEGWLPVCRVTALSEVLAPSPAAPTSARHMVPVERTDGPGFQLKGTEALRALVRATPPPLRLEPVSELPPMLGPEPVTEPAAPMLDPEPVTSPAAPAMLDAVAVHPVLRPTQVEVRIRGGAWFALGGGLVGGVLVALVLWGMGLRGGVGPVFHTGSSGTVMPVSAPVQPRVAVAPSVEAPKPLAPAATMPGPVLDRGTALSGSTGFTVPFSTPELSTVASGVTGPGTAMSTPPLPLVKSTPATAKAEPAPQHVTLAPRPVATVPPMRKVAKVEVAFEEKAPVKEAREAPRAAEDALDEDLGPDADFERELNGPPAGAKQAMAQRTVWIPPEPTRTEMPASLSQSDIFAVVVANKGDISACVGAGKPQGTEEGKRVVVRWSIAPSGKVKDVVTETSAVQGTALAHCLEEKIRAWTFPKHREQGAAVRFPFVY